MGSVKGAPAAGGQLGRRVCKHHAVWRGQAPRESERAVRRAGFTG